MTPDEEWRPVSGHEGRFEVSSLGRLRSVDHAVQTQLGKRTYAGRILMTRQPDHRYAEVTVFYEGKRYRLRPHAAVAEAFLGPRPDGLMVCHGNDDKTDNRLSNLRYDTASANGLDAVAHGRNVLANRTHCDRGHEFTPENTAWRTDSPGARRCRTCRAIRNAARYRAA